MKKYLRFLTVFLMIFLLAGCGAWKAETGNAGTGSDAGETSEVVTWEADDEGLTEDAVTDDESPGEGEGSAACEVTGEPEESTAVNETPEGALEEEDEHTRVSGGSDGSEAHTADGDAPKADNADADEGEKNDEGGDNVEYALYEDGTYTSREDVALYIHLYGKLPSNFITKKEAERLGWPGGSLEPYAPGMCIGGSRFGNYEGLLPEKEGRVYTECDIDTLRAEKRGAKRIVFSNDGLIYYTEDHYQSFELLYGEPE